MSHFVALIQPTIGKKHKEQKTIHRNKISINKDKWHIEETCFKMFNDYRKGRF